MDAQCAAKLATKKSELAIIDGKINALNRATYGMDAVSKHFYLGRVGGSGRNVHRLNKQRERDLEKTIENAKKITTLNAQKNSIEIEIKALENGAWRPEAEIKAEAKDKRKKTRNALAEKEKQVN